MVKLTAEMVYENAKVNDLKLVKTLNCWAFEIDDISILEEIPNIEILTLSVNNISTLKPIQYCKNLCELYMRSNEISDLNEIYYLKKLKYLKVLWLADNECADEANEPNYRLTVLRNLPKLTKLDNSAVLEEEIELASKLGRLIEKPSNNNSESIESQSGLMNSKEVDKCILPVGENSSGEDGSNEDGETESHIRTELIAENEDDTINQESEGLSNSAEFARTLRDTTFGMSDLDVHELSRITEATNESSQRMAITLEEANKLREELGLKPYLLSTKPKTMPQSPNVISAILALINDLNCEGLDMIIDACENRKALLQSIRKN